MLRRLLRWLGLEVPEEYDARRDWLIREVEDAKDIVRRQNRIASAFWRAREGIGRE